MADLTSVSTIRLYVYIGAAARQSYRFRWLRMADKNTMSICPMHLSIGVFTVSRQLLSETIRLTDKTDTKNLTKHQRLLPGEPDLKPKQPIVYIRYSAEAMQG